MRLSSWLVGLALLTTMACSSSSTTPTTVASVNVLLKDSPFTDAKAFLVTFSEVSVHGTGADFIPLAFTGGLGTRTCDLKKLTSAQDLLGTGPMSTGHYTQVRLVVASAAIYFDNVSSGAACAPTIAAPAGNSATVEVASGDVKLNREFDVTLNGPTTLTLDIDGDHSVHATGNGDYIMTPVISVVSVQ
jgi:hypothetical protein